MWQLGIKVADEIKFASQLTLKEGDYFGLSRPNVIKCPSEWKRVGRQVRVIRWEKGGGGGASQGMQVASRPGKGRETDTPLEPQEGNMALLTP